ncbi:hypothetical protein LOC54_03680 [Acetobacter sp. AN02]|uniref:hypothetical protein n=1 Tax=Acetobacter sp. AN02 TaxID=2894186 RepID=UPI00243450E4|nr:hypothetical protein [Acetobacter sp. AN02]MDG6094223.1 hypothetical protein [Acetobacter sp. AN02]
MMKISSFLRRPGCAVAPVLCLMLTACLDTSHPFRDPGKLGQELAGNPPPSRLDIPAVAPAGLPAEAGPVWAQELAAGLLQQTVPAMAQGVRPGDWWLRLGADVRGGQVVPLYTVMTPQGHERATEEGLPVPLEVWTHADGSVVKAISADAVPKVTAVLTGIQAAVMQKDPQSLMHRPARIYFSGVEGAPGDGNISLARAFVASMRGARDIVQTTPGNPDYTLHTKVKLSKGPAGSRAHPTQSIEIAWRVTDKKGSEVGIATQLHDIDAHSLDGYWGDVAFAAAQEAAQAVEEMISRYSGRNNKPVPDPADGKAAPPPEKKAESGVPASR